MLSLGINDIISYSAEDFTDMYREFADKVLERTPVSQIYIMGLSPVVANCTYVKNDKVNDYNDTMAKFFKDPDGKLIAALGNDVATPAGCTELTANTEDAAHEKHVPVVETERDGHVIRARVGSVEHPSLPEHYIEWIALEAEGRLEVHYLEPGMKPATFFAGGSKTGTVYAYCNLHGLWSATF